MSRAPSSAIEAAVEALLRQVHAHPDADDARLVLADALLDAGDPRGELIALQVASGDDERTLDRIDLLLLVHGKAWLGTLRGIAYRARFARGFVSRLELDGRWTATDEKWARHALDPALATVEDLIPGRAVGPIYARFVASPAMTALRRVEVFDRPTLEALRETPAALVHVSCPRWKAGRYVHELASQVLPACERFPALRSLAIYIDGFPHVMAWRHVEQLASLTLAGGLGPGLALWPRLPRQMSLTIALTAMLDDCATTRIAWPGALRLTRDADGVVARAAGDWLIGELIARFALLPHDVHRLEVEGGGKQLPALTTATARRGIELVMLPVPRRTGYIVRLGK